ncbi:MAG TPA: PfkB family carbohydrate kinase [Acidimicrobiales bacterium]|nr:PfkB family carbohydrate kinase [Acidimicrobiales bacterium]
MSSEEQRFDLLCVGRLGVDLYGEQDGTPLDAIQTFVKYVGGSAANVCVGVARLGLITAMCSRVGDEGLGQFVLDALSREGINTTLVQRDPIHPTGVVALALYKRESFPRIFFYTDSADLSFEQAQLDWNTIGRTDAVLLTGSYLVNASLLACSHAIASSVHERGGRVVLDVDYRPVLWSLVPVGSGNDMQTSSPQVTEIYQKILPVCDLVVGTEEEIAVAGGSTDVHAALCKIRSLTEAAIVLKRGAKGASVYDGPIPAKLDEGIGAPSYSVDVLNNTGAGDAFLSGFLSRWLRNHKYRECVQSGNASGAIVVTRNGCTPAMPFADEQARFMSQAGIRRPDDDEVMERLHRIGSRRPTVPWRFLLSLRDLDLLALIKGPASSSHKIDELRQLLSDAIFQVSDEEHAIGILVDSSIDREILEEAASREIFISRSIGSDREQLRDHDNEESGIELRTWHGEIIPTASAHIRRDRPKVETEHQWQHLARLMQTCRMMEREMLVDLCPQDESSLKGSALAQLLVEGYQAGVRPEYWMLPELTDPPGLAAIADLILEKDSSCRGYFLRTRPSETELQHKGLAEARNNVACRGVVQFDVCDPFVLNTWLRGSLHNAEFVDAIRIGIRQRIQASQDSRS